MIFGFFKPSHINFIFNSSPLKGEEVVKTLMLINILINMETVQRFILHQEAKQRTILQFLHDLLLAHPEIICKIRYKIPFYYRKSWICYLNPVRKKDAIELAFVRGNELSNEQGLLESKGRKQVFGITFSSVEEIPQRALLELIQEAILLDETVPYASKRRKKE